MDGAELDRALAVAKEAVRSAGAAARPWWRAGVPTETKPDRSPVTRADRDAEAAILEVVRGAFPTHGVLAEESGALGPTAAEARWIVDPLDGTRGFLRGDPTWGPLVALEVGGRIVVAAAGLPVTGETWWAARGRGCFRDGEPVRVSRVARLEDATVAVGFLRGLTEAPHRERVIDLLRRADRVRGPGDFAACALVLSGRADVWLEAGVAPWDLAAPSLLLEEAGGRCTDWDGGAAWPAGRALGTNGLLHEVVATALRGAG